MAPFKKIVPWQLSEAQKRVVAILPTLPRTFTLIQLKLDRYDLLNVYQAWQVFGKRDECPQRLM